MHSGHTNRISDFSWDPMEQWVIASAGEDNIIQLWEMVKFYYILLLPLLLLLLLN